MSKKNRRRTMDLPSFKAFHGYQSSFIPFSSAYYLYLASWDNTPTGISSFTNIWVITPENKRILFADPPASSEIVCLYHDFHEIYGASVSLDWASDNHLLVQGASLDGDYEFNVEFYLRETIASRLLAALASSPPTRFMVSKPVVAISNFLANLLVAKGGATMYGKTETGQTYYSGGIERLMLVEKGSAIMNGKDLGDISSPTWPIEFGDGVPFVQPVIKSGTLYIPFEDEMLEEST
jgi:hypothetical protein